MVGSAADTDVEVILDLAAEDVGIGSLGGQDQALLSVMILMPSN